MDYRVYIFDCDGVILDSNALKSEAMGETVSEFGPELTKQFVDYHRGNGGVSRYKKFDYFLEEIVGKPDQKKSTLLVARYGSLVRSKLLEVAFTEGALDFIHQAKVGATLYIVSGGDQQELRYVFPARGLDNVFAAIYGSPVDKHTHCQNIKSRYEEGTPILFVGDSRLDHEAARDNGFDFLFLSRYTDFDNWQSYCQQHSLDHATDFKSYNAHRTV